jgi:hypothetical protein
MKLIVSKNKWGVVVALATAAASVTSCGWARATEEDLQEALDKANAATQKAREDSTMAWHMTACQICTYSNCMGGFNCAIGTDKICSDYATSYCQEVGCSKYESLQKCQAYIQICRDSKRSDYEDYDKEPH